MARFPEHPSRWRGKLAAATAVVLVAGLSSSTIASAAIGDISTLAGTGAGCPSSACYAGDGGPATSAVLWNPTGVATAADGAVYIADNRNNGVRVVLNGTIDTVLEEFGAYDVAVDDARGILYVSASAPGSFERVTAVDLSSGAATVIAGGSSGFAGDGGPASAAQFRNIAGIDVGPDGDVFIADKGNQRVRRIDVGVTPATIATVAGTGAAGGDDGAATTVAQLADPLDVAVAVDGTAYIADQLTNRVRILSGGNVGSFAGNFTAGFSGDGGPATSAALNRPSGLAVAGDGAVLVADSQNNRVRRVAPDGTITTIVGTGAVGGGDGGPAVAAGLAFPIGLATTPAGAVYIASQLENRIREVEGASAPGSVSGLIGIVEGTTVTLEWEAPSDDGGAPVTGYVIFRDGVEIGTSAGPTFTDTTSEAGTTYLYEVFAVNVAGRGPGVEISVTIEPGGGSPTTATTTPSTTTSPGEAALVTPRFTG